ncbi:hypothetical protein ACHAW6_007549, partial [Cyclotella cf. meneghiniana]
MSMKSVFLDGPTKELAVNTIAEALYAQCNPDGNQYIMFDIIVDYRKNPMWLSLETIRSRLLMVRRLSHAPCKVWELCCEWKDGSTSWQKLSDLKESHPHQVAEFALATGIVNEPASNCTRYHKQTHKFGIELQKTVDEAYAINKVTGITFWHDAIELEMKNVQVTFDILPD